MTVDRWTRIRDLFERCLDQPPESRIAFLTAYDTEPEVRVEVEKLLAQDSAAGSFLVESPDVVKELRTGPRSQFAPGDRLANRFELLRLIGRGGMGEVYAALDVDLEEQVAVKVLHADLLGDAGANQRFRRELQLARKVTHPNVCRLFDLGRHTTPSGDVFFLTMELVEGETLADRLRRTGRLHVDEARPIVEQLVQGLAAAHHAGIIHRDLKPSNVMLTGTRAVIMDFGLARRDASLTCTAYTSPGNVFGTLLYMAPEQLRGESATERTDIYAFGLLLYEITTGTRPFSQTDSVASALQRLTQTPPPPTQLAPDLPRNWSRTIVATLELDPQHRPQSVQTVLEHLQGRGPRRRLTRRQLVSAAAIPAGAMSLYWAVPRLSITNGPAQGVSSIYLTDVSNTTGDRRFDNVTTVIRSHLAQSAHFDVLNEGQVQSLVTQMQRGGRKEKLRPEEARELALRHGPGTVVLYGSLSALGSAFVLAMRIEKPGSRPDEILRSWSKQFNASGEQDLITELRSVAVWTRECVGESPEEIEKQNRSTADISTGSWDALQFYRQAREARTRRDTKAAELFLQDALRIDPRFVSALRETADLLVSEGRLLEGFGYWKKAVSSAGARNLTSQERFRMEGLYYDDVRDFLRAERVYRAWAARYPADYIPLFYRASMLSCLGRDEEAIRTWEYSFKLKHYPTTAEELAKLALLQGDILRAENWLSEIRAMGSPRAQASVGARVLICRGHYAEALKVFESFPRLKDLRSNTEVAQLHASLYADLNRPEQAIRILQEQIFFQRGEGGHQFVAGLTLALATLLAQLKRFREAVDLADSCLRPDLSPGTLEKLARVYRLATMPQRISPLLDRIPRRSGFPVFDHARAIVAGEAAFARKEFATALREFETAASVIPSGYLPPVSLWELFVAAGSLEKASGCLTQPSLNPAYLWRHMERLWPGVWRYVLSLFTSVGPIGPDLNNSRKQLQSLTI